VRFELQEASFVALNQVVVLLPQTVPTGDSVPMFVKVVLTDGSIIRSNTVTVAIQDAAPAVTTK
jgi:hypothetical protein